MVQTWLARLLSKFASGQTRATQPQPERRRFQRWPVRGVIAFRNLTKRDTVGTAYIEDISQGGLRLATISTVDEGDAVSCELEGLLLMGEVVHRRNFGPIRVIGIRLTHDLDESALKAALDLFWKPQEGKSSLQATPF